jgi:serine/threonine-protein kinase
VHRDIKPENVMLEGPERTAVVMDFGIAKTEGPEAKGLTGTGMLVGTPQYMSPEQATGERALDARSDQYSLAMVGYRMLTGRFPFAGDSVQQLIFKTVTEVPIPASDLSSDVPKELSSVLAKALSKAPSDRYESMAAFSAAIAATDRNLETGSATRGFRRPEPDMPTRIRQGLQSLPSWKHPLVALAVVGLIGSVAVNGMLQSRTGTAVAANRADAIFAAKAFLASRGVQSLGGAYPSFEPRTHAKQELMTILGSDSTDRRAATDIPIWLWTIVFPGTSSGLWSVEVGPQNRIVGFVHPLPDSARLPTITHDSARVLAEREIEARGWSPAALALVTDSTVRRRHRVDHVFRWRRQADAIPGRGTDSSFVQVLATVRGDQVGNYETNLRLPDSHEAEHETESLFKVVTFVGWTLAIVLCGFAFGMGVTRQRVDQLQWGTVLRLLGVSAALLALVGIPMLAKALALAQSSADFFAPLIIFPIMIAMAGSALLFTGVVGESLAKELRPSMVQGVDDVSRGRLMIPEVMTGIFWGYVIGFIAVGANAVLEMVAWRGFGVASIPGKVSLLFSMALPSAYGIAALAGGILGAFALLFAVAFFARTRLTARLALVLPALLTVAMFAISPDMTELSLGLVVLIFSFGMWHYGFLAVVIGFWVPDVIKDAVTVMRSGSSEFMAAGIITLLVGFAPLALALFLYRRYRRET